MWNSVRQPRAHGVRPWPRSPRRSVPCSTVVTRRRTSSGAHAPSCCARPSRRAILARRGASDGPSCRWAGAGTARTPDHRCGGRHGWHRRLGQVDGGRRCQCAPGGAGDATRTAYFGMARESAGRQAGAQGLGDRRAGGGTTPVTWPRTIPPEDPADKPLDHRSLRRLAAWFYAVEYGWRYLSTVAGPKRRGEVVICDRYVYDLRDSPWPGSRASVFAEWLVPAPDVMVLPDAPVEMIHAPQAGAAVRRAACPAGSSERCWPSIRAVRRTSSWTPRRHCRCCGSARASHHQRRSSGSEPHAMNAGSRRTRSLPQCWAWSWGWPWWRRGCATGIFFSWTGSVAPVRPRVCTGCPGRRWTRCRSGSSQVSRALVGFGRHGVADHPGVLPAGGRRCCGGGRWFCMAAVRRLRCSWSAIPLSSTGSAWDVAFLLGIAMLPWLFSALLEARRRNKWFAVRPAPWYALAISVSPHAAWLGWC